MWKRWIHKFQIWLHMTTWFAYKIGFYKICKSKTCHFERSCKLHHIPYLAITTCLWLPLTSFFRCNLIVWRPHECVHDVLNNFSCLWIWVIHVMDQFPKWHLGWIALKIFYIPIITPYGICQPAQLICFRPQSCGVLLGQLLKEFVVPNSL